MKKHKINAADYAGKIIKALPRGILLTTKLGDKTNSMVIGWGTIGVNWGKPVFVAYVRESRYTHELLDQNPEFTINVPTGDFDREILAVCGAKSGRDMDKLAVCGLTPAAPEVISVPGLREFPLTLECRVIYRQDEDLALFTPEMREKLYPAENDGRRDFHTTYYGEIVDAYILEP